MSNVKDSTEIKGLETRRNKLQAQRKQLNIEIQEKQQESAGLKSRIDTLQKKIEKLKSKKSNNLIVSEHALLRYIERVIGIDLQEIQNKVLPPEKVLEVKAMGNCTYGLGDHKITIKDGIVVTVLGDE